METLFDQLSRLSDDQLVATVKTFADNERTAIADLITGLAVMAGRQLYLGRGASSLFTYCVDVLRLSPDAAYNREQAAYAALECPAILNDLRTGALSMTAVRILRPVLTPENRADVLEAARFRTVREVEQMVAGLAPPATDQVSRVTRLGPDRYLFQFTGNQAVRDKVREAQSLLRHAVPGGEFGAIFERALDALIRNIERARFASVARPRGARRVKPGSRAIPAPVRRGVRARDGDRCAFVGPEGRCQERDYLQFHHRIAYADGGQPTIENIELRCAAHNRYEAELWFGPFVTKQEPPFQNDGS